MWYVVWVYHHPLSDRMVSGCFGPTSELQKDRFIADLEPQRNMHLAPVQI